MGVAHEPRRERGRGPAGRATRRHAPAVGIVGHAVDGVGRLQVREERRHVRLAEDDGARRAQSRDDLRVPLGDELRVFLQAPGGREAGDVDGLLDRHRQTQQRRPVTPGEVLVRLRRLVQRSLDLDAEY